eukprot:gene51820-69356_t
MATSIYPEYNKLTTHMGGEGAPWIGQQAFSQVPHVFQNLGDGTYFHSGFLAIRAAVAAKVNITYKILYNDAVAMTGGQPVDGTISVPQIARQVEAEGARRIVVVSDDIDKYNGHQGEFPAGTTFHDRSEMDAVQRTLREVPGVTLLIYDQTCAAEKRRRRKKAAKPGATGGPGWATSGRRPEGENTRVFINEAVCEGCGDCGQASNCLSVIPVETDWGRKRQIEQSSCNKDFSCINGFCPSFVTLEGAQLRRRVGASFTPAQLAAEIERIGPPAPWAWTGPFDLLVTGVGGTG